MRRIRCEPEESAFTLMVPSVLSLLDRFECNGVDQLWRRLFGLPTILVTSKRYAIPVSITYQSHYIHDEDENRVFSQRQQ